MNDPKIIIPDTAIFPDGPIHVQLVYDPSRPDVTFVRLSTPEKYLLVPIPNSLMEDPEADVWELAKAEWINHDWGNEEIA